MIARRDHMAEWRIHSHFLDSGQECRSFGSRKLAQHHCARRQML
jgi:hypothetical protein